MSTIDPAALKGYADKVRELETVKDSAFSLGDNGTEKMKEDARRSPIRPTDTRLLTGMQIERPDSPNAILPNCQEPHA